MRRRDRQLLGEPVELLVRHLAVVMARHRRVERDDPQAVHVVDAIHRARTAAAFVEQPAAERRPVVVVAHDPDHLRAEAFGDRIDDAADAVVGVGFALVGEVAREDDRLGSAT